MNKLKPGALRQLESEWHEKLKASGFKDAEDVNRNLKYPDLRTIAFESRDHILDFFLRLDHFMTHFKCMSSRDRKILSLYSQGVFVPEISKKLKISEVQTRKRIRFYKEIILTIKKVED